MGKYDDIINVERPDTGKHPKMSVHDRAAQFAPFAALTGHKEAVAETGRVTQKKIVLDESEKAELDYNLSCLMQQEGEKNVSVTYFEADLFKEGGEYVTFEGVLRKADMENHRLVFTDGKIIDVNDIYELELI